MPAKQHLWALMSILVSSSITAQTISAPGDELGYRTDGYELGQGNTHSGPATDYGHAHFTKPRYGNSAYYRSYHAHKDIIKEHGGDVYGPPWQWNPYYYDHYGYPGRPHSYQRQAGSVLESGLSPATAAGTVHRRLEQTLDGKCYELKRSQNTELRIELPADQCMIETDTESTTE